MQTDQRKCCSLPGHKLCQIFDFILIFCIFQTQLRLSRYGTFGDGLALIFRDSVYAVPHGTLAKHGRSNNLRPSPEL